MIRNVFEKLKNKPLAVKSALFLAFFILGIGTGWLCGMFLDPARDGGQGKHEQRLSGYRFISPLLDCEVKGETVTFGELRPFQEKVEQIIRERAGAHRLELVAVYFRDLNNGPWFGIRDREKFIPASLLKLPIVMACLKQAEHDRSFFARPVLNDLTEDWSARQLIKPSEPLVPGRHYTVEDLIRRALRFSDNNAAHLLARTVDNRILTNVFQDMGVPAPKLNVPYDFVSPKAYASFFRILYNSSYLNKEMSQVMLAHLAQSSYRNGIVAGVPDYVLVAHKYGEHSNGYGSGIKQLHDCGIVYYPGRPYLLCIMSRGHDFDSLDGIIRDISGLVYQEMDRQSRSLDTGGIS